MSLLHESIASLKNLLMKVALVRAIKRRFDTPVESVFSAVYRNRLWGKTDDDFYSGAGSHDARLTRPYVDVTGEFLRTFEQPPRVVDLGCGDFAVGSQLTDLCESYVACDIVTELIERNSKKFVRPNLTFRKVNIIEDTLPEGQVAFVRQVLQHLSNDQIMKVTKKLVAFKYLVITEHLPLGSFVSNGDLAAGGAIRLGKGAGSGVRLEDPPFSLPHREKRVLCSIEFEGAVIETTLYRCF